MRFAVAALLFAALPLAACVSAAPPIVEAARLSDTADTVGPYVVAARVTSARPLDKVELVWRLSGAPAFSREAMTAADSGWTAAIPGVASGGQVLYRVEATTVDGDVGADPAPPATASFKVD